MPLRFMKVAGFASKTCSSPIAARAVSAWHWRFLTSTPQSFAKRSMVRKPRLCGVDWYSVPGLPNPTISFTLRQHSSTANLLWSFAQPDGFLRLRSGQAPTRPHTVLAGSQLFLFFLLGLFGLL